MVLSIQSKILRFLFFLTLITFYLKNLGFAQSTTPKECPKGFRESLLNGKKGETYTIKTSCLLNLKAEDTIYSDIEIKGALTSNFKLDCHSATLGTQTNPLTLWIKSEKTNSSNWSRPENVSIENCTIYGSIRVMGLGKNGEDPEVRQSSLTIGHTERAQNAAPKNITIKNCSFISSSTTPIYFAPGVTYSSILDSKTSGNSEKGSSVYLDAESAFNTIARNQFTINTLREQIAVDGSANNLIKENYFYNTNYGSIYLYRNCGEGGTIRHQKPTKNQILNNFFYYKNYYGLTPAIFIGSRNALSSFCNLDGKLGFGSSGDDLDHADETLVKDNLFLNRNPKFYILTGLSIKNTVITGNKSTYDTPTSLAPSQKK